MNEIDNEIDNDPYMRKLALASRNLQHISNQLRQWAKESLDGGWSTHQVQSQRELSAHIEDILDAIGRY